MKNIIKKLILKIFSIFKIKNVIVFESNADYGDNSRAFSEYLVENNYNEKYKIYWFVNDASKFKNKECKNVKFITMWHNVTGRTVSQWIKYIWIVKNAKYLISSNRSLLRLNSKTKTINVNHGSPLKKVADLNLVPKDIDMFLAASDFFVDITRDQMHLDKKQIICVGNPRDDVLFKDTKTKEKITDFNKFSKVILWLPTFRKQATSDRVDSNFEYPLGLPLIYSVSELEKLNAYLKKKNIAILFKLHPAQDLSIFKANSLSNIIIINDAFLTEKDISLTEFYKLTDALITDYSSVYYDYLLLDKMIGFAIDDYETYSKTKGLFVDNALDYMAGNKMYNIEDLYQFIDELSKNQDKYKDERKKMKKLFHKYCDDKSSARFAKHLNL